VHPRACWGGLIYRDCKIPSGQIPGDEPEQEEEEDSYGWKEFDRRRVLRRLTVIYGVWLSDWKTRLQSDLLKRLARRITRRSFSVWLSQCLRKRKGRPCHYFRGGKM